MHPIRKEPTPWKELLARGCSRGRSGCGIGPAGVMGGGRMGGVMATGMGGDFAPKLYLHWHLSHYLPALLHTPCPRLHSMAVSQRWLCLVWRRRRSGTAGQGRQTRAAGGGADPSEGRGTAPGARRVAFQARRGNRQWRRHGPAEEAQPSVSLPWERSPRRHSKAGGAAYACCRESGEDEDASVEGKEQTGTTSQCFSAFLRVRSVCSRGYCVGDLPDWTGLFDCRRCSTMAADQVGIDFYS